MTDREEGLTRAAFTDRSTAEEHPCELRRYHAPEPTRTQGHHRHPVYLQNRVYGRIKDPELLWLCGTDHDSIHDWISYRLGEARRPVPEPGRLAKEEAERTLEWYLGLVESSEGGG